LDDIGEEGSPPKKYVVVVDKKQLRNFQGFGVVSIETIIAEFLGCLGSIRSLSTLLPSIMKGLLLLRCQLRMGAQFRGWEISWIPDHSETRFYIAFSIFPQGIEG